MLELIKINGALAIKNIRQNYWHPTFKWCGGYSLAVGAAGSALLLIFENQIYALLVLSLIVILVSFLFRETSLFDKTIVDNTYYVLAIIGAVLFFASNSHERGIYTQAQDVAAAQDFLRERQDELEDIQSQEGAIIELEKNVAADPTQALRSLSTEIAGYIARKRFILTDAELSSCVGTAFQPFSEDGLLLNFPDPRSRERPMFPSLETGIDIAICQSALDKQSNQLAQFVIDFVPLGAPQDIDKYRNQISEMALQTITIGGQEMWVGAAVDMIEGRFEIDSWRERVAEAQASLTQARDALNEEQLESETASGNADLSFAEWVVQFGWPIILICALGLKLNRRRS